MFFGGDLPAQLMVFKLFGGIFCFIANILIMLRAYDIEKCVKNFLAVIMISNVDNLMAKTVISYGDYDKDLNLQLSVAKEKLTDGELIWLYVRDEP